MKKILIVIYVLLQVSCVGFYTTSEGGFRVNKTKNFKYSKEKFTSMPKTLIDTNSIYVMDSVFNKWNENPMERKGYRFVRFFSGGQALFIYNDGIPKLEKINNKNIGTPAYYILEGNKLKVNIFSNLNGGTTDFFYGKINNKGNLVIYEDTAVQIYFLGILKSYKMAENSGRISYWTKIKVENIENYKPNW
jgi:hypothetical protein